MITKLLLRPYPNSTSYVLLLGGLPDSFVEFGKRNRRTNGLETRLSKLHGIKLVGLSLVVSPSDLSPPALAITFSTAYLSGHAAKLIMAAVIATIDPPQLPPLPDYRRPLADLPSPVSRRQQGDLTPRGLRYDPYLRR